MYSGHSIFLRQNVEAATRGTAARRVVQRSRRIITGQSNAAVAASSGVSDELKSLISDHQSMIEEYEKRFEAIQNSLNDIVSRLEKKEATAAETIAALKEEAKAIVSQPRPATPPVTGRTVSPVIIRTPSARRTPSTVERK